MVVVEGAPSPPFTGRDLPRTGRLIDPLGLPLSGTVPAAPESANSPVSSRSNLLEIFRAELRYALMSRFTSAVSAQSSGYRSSAGPADEVAEDTLDVAKQLAAEAPAQADMVVTSIRSLVREAAQNVREISGDTGTDDLDDAVRQIDRKLSDIEDEFATSRESRAKVLSVDSRTKQRSSIHIRTQEGDIVRVDLRQVDRFIATDAVVSDSDRSASLTELNSSSRSRLNVKIKGQLSESELSAIQNVLAEAGKLADEFYGGSLAAAFSDSRGLEFNTEQLAWVNLRFSMKQDTRISYEALRRPSTIEQPEIMFGESQVVAAPPTQTAETPVTGADIESVAENAEPAAGAALAQPVFATFFERLAGFLRSIDGVSADGASSESIRLHFSQAFKFKLLQAVLHTTVPADKGEAADNANSLIATVIEAGTVDADAV